MTVKKMRTGGPKSGEGHVCGVGEQIEAGE